MRSDSRRKTSHTSTLNKAKDLDPVSEESAPTLSPDQSDELKAKQKLEADFQRVIAICKNWNDITSLLIIACCIFALYYDRMAPQWKHPDRAAEYDVGWSFSVASTISSTAWLFEVGHVLAAQMPRVRSLYASSVPDLTGYEDACFMGFVYTVLAYTYYTMAIGLFPVRTDPLALGGPRPVYTIRYLEWSICVPILLAISGTYPSTFARADPDDLVVIDNAARRKNTEDLQLSLRLFDRIWNMPLAASARCTSVYIWSSWLALVVETEEMRWLLLAVSFFAFAVASAEQIAVCLHMLSLPNAQEEKVCLLVIQLMLFNYYGIIYLAATFGCMSTSNEQALYSFADMGAKVCHSVILMTFRRHEDLLKMSALRDCAANVSLDLKRLIQQASAPIFNVNRKLEIVGWNLKMAELTLVSSEAARGRRLTDLVTQYETKNWDSTAGKVFEDSMEGKETSPFEMHFSANRRSSDNAAKAMVVISATPQRNYVGEVKGVFCVGQDVTEQNRQRQKAELHAASLARLIETANAPIFGVDTELNVTEWNDLVASISGVSKEEAYGRSILDLVSPNFKQAVAQALEQSCAGKSTSKFELSLKTKSILLLNATPRMGTEGKLTGCICIGQEITSIKELEERKSSMMAMVSHELKSPLHGIIGLSHSLLEEEPVTSKSKKPMMMIHNSAKRMLDMVSNIMDASVLVEDRKMRMSRDPVQLANIIEEVVLLCQQSVDKRGVSTIRPGVKLISTVTEPLPIIEADAYRCTQLIYNLVSNALKFTHQGSVTVSASHDDMEQLVIIDVKDTGIGIAPENVDRIFEPFDQEDASESRRYEGLGLGLAISREVVAKHGGSLTVKSKQGQGSTFRVLLPYKMKWGDEAENPAAPEVAPRSLSTVGRPQALPPKKTDRPKTEKLALKPADAPVSISRSSLPEIDPNRPRVILSVDDDFVNQEIISSLLKSANFEVRTAMDGGEALNFLKQNVLPALILLDVMMPGLTGQDVLKQLRKAYSPAQLPVIMVSARNDDDTIVKCFKLGCNDFVRKPFTGAELIGRVNLQLQLAMEPTTHRCKDPPSSRSSRKVDRGRFVSGGSAASESKEVFSAEPSVEVSLLRDLVPDSVLSALLNASGEEPLSLKRQQAKTTLQKWIDSSKASGIDGLDQSRKSPGVTTDTTSKETVKQHAQIYQKLLAQVHHQQQLVDELRQQYVVEQFTQSRTDPFITTQPDGLIALSFNAPSQAAQPWCLGLHGLWPCAEERTRALMNFANAERRILQICESIPQHLRQELMMLVRSFHEQIVALIIAQGQCRQVAQDAENQMRQQAIAMKMLLQQNTSLRHFAIQRSAT